MKRQVQRLGFALMALFVALFAQLNYVQVVRANKLNRDPRNTRVATRDFARPRGFVQTSDGAVVARSVPANDAFKRRREYPEADLFAHITGYFSFTYGTEGVERTYNSELAGRSVSVKFRRLGDIGKALSGDQATGNLTLSISKRLQQVARDALGPRRGSVVALNPQNGEILAMWSFPSFDPNPLADHSQQVVRDAWQRLQTDATQPLLPRAFRRRYAPGSTFKVVTASAALDRKPELATKAYPVLSQLDLPQTTRSLPNFGGGRCGGTLPQLLKVSCNTGFAQMGLDLGAENLVAEADNFGFNKRAPIDEPVVAPSVFPDVATFKRNLPALAQSAIGQQDVAATPLQMALVAAAIGNKGVAMKPHVMREIRDDQGAKIGGYDVGEWLRATSPETAASVRDMMIGVVNGGTATRAAIPGVQVAAKTGTAQTTGNDAHAWLIGFAPADNPTVAVAVIVESQPGVSEATGGRVAAPIARTVMQAALSGAP
ncbi:MAG: penicillin-binding protein [Actinomycetota bacterium]|nr:penicillin-binding protein [Actinomycetota bacterium]